MNGLMKNLSIKARISWAFGLVLLIFAGVSGNSTLSLYQADDLFDEYREVAILSGNLLEMRGDFYAARVNAENYLRDGEDAALQRSRAMLAESLEAYEVARSAVISPEFAPEVDGLRAAVVEYQTLFDRLVREGRNSEAAIDQLDGIGTRTTAMITQVAEAFDERRDAIGPVVNATLCGRSPIEGPVTFFGAPIHGPDPCPATLHFARAGGCVDLAVGAASGKRADRPRQLLAV